MYSPLARQINSSANGEKKQFEEFNYCIEILSVRHIEWCEGRAKDNGAFFGNAMKIAIMNLMSNRNLRNGKRVLKSGCIMGTLYFSI